MSRKSSSPDERPAAKPAIAPEFSRPIELGEVPSAGQRWSIEATAEERAALARRFEVVALDSLAGTVQVAPRAVGHGVRVEGRFNARVTQLCVVTLERFESDIADDFRLELVDPDELENAGGEEFRDDDVEPLEGPTLDLGELVAQYLSLALDPYPRKPGVALDLEATLGHASDGIKTAQNPFAVLGGLKRKM